MRTQPILTQNIWRHVLRPGNSTPTFLLATTALKRLSHVVLCARIEEGELIAGLETLVQIRVDSNLPSLHVEHEGWPAGVIDVNQIAVELDVQVAGCLDRSVGACCWCRVRDTCEHGVGREADQGDGARGEVPFKMLDTQETSEVRFHPCWDLVRGCLPTRGRRGGGGGGGRHGALVLFLRVCYRDYRKPGSFAMCSPWQ